MNSPDSAGPDGVPTSPSKSHLTDLLDALLVARKAALAQETRRAGSLEELSSATREGGRNLLHYFALRQLDLTGEQRALARLGLSSLGRSERHVLATIDAVIARLAAEAGVADLPDDLGRRGPSAEEAARQIEDHTNEVFGPAIGDHATRLMATLPAEAAGDPALVDRLVEAGMAVARINAAHHDAETWRAMIANVRAAADRAGRTVRVVLDLPGPNLRTGMMPRGAEVLRARPARDDFGRILNHGRVRFHRAPSRSDLSPRRRGETVVVPVVGPLLMDVEPGDEIEIDDARGRTRRLGVISVQEDECVAVCDRTVIFTSGLPVRIRRGDHISDAGAIGEIPPLPTEIELRRGDQLQLRSGSGLGSPPYRGPDGALREPGMVTVDVPELFTSVAVDDRIMFDQGLVEGVVVDHSHDSINVEITRPERASLRPGTKINLPDTELPIPGLTVEDSRILAETADLIDLVAMSFVGSADGVARLHKQLDTLASRTGRQLGVILKIERKKAIESLPALLLEVLRRPPMALMIARGDLAVEVGFDWLAELEVELVWFGAAAHVPVVMASHVLESYAERGAPTRAELTDAAWSARAECVMLHDGDYIPETMVFLSSIFARMERRVEKRTPMLLPLFEAFPQPPHL